MNGETEKLLHSFTHYLRLERNLSANSLLAYESDVHSYLEFLEKNQIALKSVEHPQIGDYLWHKKESGVTARTILRAIESIKSFHRFLFLQEIVSSDPSSKILSPKQIQKLPSFLSERQMERLLSSIPQEREWGIRFKAMLELLYATGMRVSELVRCRTSQLDLESGFVRIIGKGDKERIVPIGSACRTSLRRYLEYRDKKFKNKKIEEETLFLTKLGRSMTRNEFWRQLRQQARKAGIEKIYPHMIRHSFATHMLSGGSDLKTVQELLGHSSLLTTQIYTHLQTKQLKEMHRKFHPRP